MGSISHVITTTLPHLPSTRSLGFPISHSNSRLLSLPPTRVAKKVGVFAEHSSRSSTASAASVDFSDPDWKIKFQEDWEARFRLPHLTDIFPNAPPIPSTFCLKMRTPIDRDFPGHYSLDEEWHGYINNNDRVLLKTIYYSSPTSAGAECIDPDCTWVEQWVHRAGPREKIYYKPEEVKAAIVTCGGLCPGLNDVIRQLSRKVVQNIHLSGGSLLGVSRGGPGVSDIVDSLEKRGINMLFVLGGNGTHAGANAIHHECRKRRLKVSVIGVPKTIDNDILLMDKTFGFDTAVEEAQRAINSAYIEAHSAYHGIGVVKLMGRSSGFIAMQASLSSGQVDICLIPEVPFNLHGPHGVLSHLKYLLETKGSAVVCVAEGAGQTKKYFKEIGVHADVKYIDPTYMIRAIRANASDGILCTVLGQNAVHGAFAGYSGITVGLCNTHYVYFPIPEVISHPRLVDPNSRMWHRCLTSTGQPDFI
ncbi:hypothetical protein AAZV13_18G114700 [Glycine max]